MYTSPLAKAGIIISSAIVIEAKNNLYMYLMGFFYIYSLS
jgi:hypothetical protein